MLSDNESDGVFYHLRNQTDNNLLVSLEQVRMPGSHFLKLLVQHDFARIRRLGFFLRRRTKEIYQKSLEDCRSNDEIQKIILTIVNNAMK